MATIASLGSALQDIYLVDGDDFVSESVHQKSVLAKLEIGTKVDIDNMTYSVGGGGINSAVTFARAGHHAFFLGSVGTDLPSQIIRNRCQKESISTEFIHESPKNTGCSVILLDSTTGERTILTHRGASADFAKISPTILEKIKPDWLYITTLQGDFTTLEKFIKKAHALGIKIMFNPGKRELQTPAKLLPLLKNLDILLLNESEAALLATASTRKPKTEHNLFKPKLYRLLTKINSYAKITIITSGKTGGILSYSQNTAIEPISSPKHHIKNSPVPNQPTESIYSFGIYSDVPVLDTTGAGDAFGSGFLAAYADSENIEKSLTFASANSTNTVQYLGANDHLLYLKTTKLKNFPIKKIK